jgi:hypothetical protein
MWKWSTVMLLIIVAASNGWWLYREINAAVTEKYRQQIEYEQTRSIAALLAIAGEQLKGKSSDELLILLDRALPNSKPFEKDGAININFLAFPLAADGTIAGVKTAP